MKSPLVITSFVIAGLLILAGAGYVLGRNPPPAEPLPQDTPPVEQPAPPEESKPTSEPPSPSLEQQAEDFQTAIADVCASGESKEATLVVTETEANNLAAQMLIQVEIPEDISLEINSVHIDFEADNNVVAEIGSVLYGFKVTIKSRAHISVEENKPKVELTDISFGFIPLPQAIKDRAVVYFTQEIDNLLSQLTERTIDCNGTTVGLELKEISVQPGKMTVTVLIRPGM